MDKLQWMYENAPEQLRLSLQKQLMDVMSDEYESYIYAMESGLNASLMDLVQILKEDIHSALIQDFEHIYSMRNLAMKIVASLRSDTYKITYLRLCARFDTNGKPCVSFVGSDLLSSIDNPGLFHNSNPMTIKAKNLPNTTEYFYYTLMLKVKGEYKV